MTKDEAKEAIWLGHWDIDNPKNKMNKAIEKIYDDFEEQLDMERRKAYLDGSNDSFKALKEAGKLK